jgi:hypothetical protein
VSVRRSMRKVSYMCCLYDFGVSCGPGDGMYAVLNAKRRRQSSGAGILFLLGGGGGFPRVAADPIFVDTRL